MIEDFGDSEICYNVDEKQPIIVTKQRIRSTRNIYETISKCTAVFEKRTPQSFATWCKNKRLSFLNGKEIRQDGTRLRELYIMEDIYYSNFEKHN